jgi:2-dehydro-3-deoxyphosphogluconate aldolase/(4S)-4-hydroxy-2-oxoglutarate aldolase
MNLTLPDILRRAPVIPVIVLHDLKHAAPLAEALVAGGLTVLEVTLRTPVALAAIEIMRRAVPEAIVGAGTLTSPEHFGAVRNAGAQFGVSPGLTPALAAASRESNWPWLPGVMTTTELMQARELGYHCCKLFPAQQAGGTGMLKALHAVFPDVSFCPTGGITADNAIQFLEQPNVLCVGGSWVAPAGLIKAGDWLAVRKLAAEAARLPRAALP